MYPNYYPKRTKQIEKSRRFAEGKDGWEKEYAKKDKEKADIRNVTIAQFTLEIKKRADVEKLAGVLVLKTNLSYEEAVNIAQIISTHITEGLEETKGRSNDL